MGAHKGTEKNSKRYKSQVKKDIHKKISDKANKTRQEYRNHGGGSKVVRRGRSDVSAAPAVYADRLKRGGMAHYGHYYPYQEGVLDKQMALSNYYDKAMKQHRSANQFNSLLTGLAAGKFEDLDENRRKILAEQQIEDEKRRRLEDIENAKKKYKETRTSNKAKLQGLRLPENADNTAIVREQDKVNRRLKLAQQTNEALDDLAGTLEKVRGQEEHLHGLAASMKDDFGTHPKVRYLATNIDKATPEMFQEARDELSAQYQAIPTFIKELEQIRRDVHYLKDANHQITNWENEMDDRRRLLYA